MILSISQETTKDGKANFKTLTQKVTKMLTSEERMDKQKTFEGKNKIFE